MNPSDTGKLVAVYARVSTEHEAQLQALDYQVEWYKKVLQQYPEWKLVEIYEELVAEMCSCFMGFDLHAEASASHIDNHKAYVQSWIQAIREKPETLIKAIKDAQAAASYMDWKTGLITDKEYEKAKGSVMEIRQKEREKER